MNIEHVLVLAAILFCLGLYNIVTRRNAIGVLIGVELILNAASINLVGFSHFNGGDVAGQVFALFVIVLAASEAAVALAIVMAIFRNFNGIDADSASILKW